MGDAERRIGPVEEPLGPADYYGWNAQYATAGPYFTPLSKDQENQYQSWLGGVSKMVGHELDPDDLTYDMRGYWKDIVNTGQWDSSAFTTGAHFPDIYKTPYHPTFSRESRYALPTAPAWLNDTLMDPLTGRPTIGYLNEMQQQARRIGRRK
jgi:hypothetical protein